MLMVNLVGRKTNISKQLYQHIVHLDNSPRYVKFFCLSVAEDNNVGHRRINQAVSISTGRRWIRRALGQYRGWWSWRLCRWSVGADAFRLQHACRRWYDRWR